MAISQTLTRPPVTEPDYEQDFYSWAFRQAALLREGRLTELDIANVAEELESLGRTQFNSLVSALRLLTMHMLKWDHQPDRRSRSWLATIVEQRGELSDILADNPGLKLRFDEALTRAFGRVRREAAAETGIDIRGLPAECPYDVEALVNRRFDLS